MSEYEKINQRVVAQKAAMRNETMKELAKLFVIVVASVLAFVFLHVIGFIRRAALRCARPEDGKGKHSVLSIAQKRS